MFEHPIDDQPARIIFVHGRRTWQWPDGTTFPVISGGDGDPDPADPDPTDPPADPPARSFTQDEVNRILAAEKRKLLADQPDLTELRRKAAAYDEAQAANQSELEKAIERATKAETERDDARGQLSKTLRDSAVIAAAVRAGAVDPSAVVALLGSDAVTIADDGTITGADDAVKALLEEKPYLAGQAPQPTPGGTPTPAPAPGGADGGARGPAGGSGITRDQLKTMSAAEIAKLDPKDVDAALAGS